MTLTEAREAIKIRGVPFGDVYERVEEFNRDALKAWYTREEGLPNLVARRAQLPVSSGDLCPSCGGFMVRTGTCLTCQSCGNSSGGCG